jgi:hypothetical protein
MLVLLMLQSAIVTSVPLLNGSADLVLLVLAAWALQERVPSAFEWATIGGILTGLVTKLPFFIPVAGYMIVAILGRILLRQVWQSPVFAMMLTTLVGTVIYHVLSWVVLSIQGVPLPIVESLNLVIFPAVLLNLVLAFPIYAVVTDLAQSIYPEEVEL